MSPLHHIHQFSGETLCVSTAGHTARHTADLRKSGFINSDAHLKKKQTSALFLWTQTDFESISDKLSLHSTMNLDTLAPEISPVANLSCQEKRRFKSSSAKRRLLWGITATILPCETCAVPQALKSSGVLAAVQQSSSSRNIHRHHT